MTPAFNEFEVLHSEVDEDLDAGQYKLEITYWENKLLKEVYAEIMLKNLTFLGGDFDQMVISYLFVGFFMIVIGLTLMYIHKIKFTDGIYHDTV